MKSLSINALHACVNAVEILKGVQLTIKPGEVHAIMGPNGSGKSTLASVIAGHPSYEVTSGSIQLDGQDVLALSPDQRSQAGLFLAFQYPVSVPGVKVQNFLRLAHQARFAAQPKKQFEKVLEFRKHLKQLTQELDINPSLLERELNEGFSGGEKKQLEIVQMAVLEPQYAILDETDSGLDIDAIKKVAVGVTKIRARHSTGILIITHYQRILEHLQPDYVHVLVSGKIIASGDASLVTTLEQKGYQNIC